MNQTYSWLKQQSQSVRTYLTLNILLGVLVGLCVIAQSALLATIIDHVYLHHATRAILMPFLGWFLGVITIRSGLHYAREMVSFKTATAVKTTLRQTLLAQWMQLSPAALSAHKTGDLTTTLLEKIEALHGFFADYLPQMMITVILPVIIAGFVFWQNWLAGLILLITAPLIPLFMALIGMQAAKYNQENFQHLSRLSAHFLDVLQGLTTLSLFNRAKAQTASIEKLSDEFREKTMRVLRVAFLSSATLELFATVSIAIIAVYLGLGLLGLMQVGFGGVRITLTSALFILLLAPEFFMPLRQLGVFYHARAEAMGAAEEILNYESFAIGSAGIVVAGASTSFHSSKNHLDEELRVSAQTHNTLSLRHIHFSYPNRPIFNDFSLDIPFGKCTVITAPSGTGKSTLLYLMAKLIAPSSGSIVMGIPFSDDDIWREQVTLLQQHPRLHFGSIADNIRLAKPSAADDEIMMAAQQAGVTEFTDQLPNGLNTVIQENNVGLSGGQIQRIALARLILKDASIILLDEPTTYLDEKNSQIIIKLIEMWRNNKTVVIATHDPKLIAMADVVTRLLAC